MFASAIVWAILSEFGVRPTDLVGIMGIGGLGYIAIKLAAAMSC
jgi:D-arabinose 1-dehydrogenase-like Zn-dependent alcohol dehydrogenase